MVMAGNNKLARTKNAGESLAFCWQFWLPYGCGTTTRGTLPDEARPGLQLEPLDAPPSGKCLCRIAPATIMVNEFVETTLNTNKT